jgi:lipopolysaccharide transport system ATP-binding protein
MSNSVAIEVKNLSKAYQLGQIGTGTISRDLERFVVTKILRKEDPFLKIGQTNDRTVKGESNIVWSLKDINFEINQGEAIGIIGRNGAGKSTLLKLLSRVTSPTTGSIKVKGRIASLLEVGTGFHPELSGRENIYLNGAILGMRKAEIKRKFDEIVDFAGVERYIDTPVKRYSSGMYVRLAFAVAAHLESEILIVDEVLAVGDAEFQKKCLGKMGDISKGEGRTVLFVSHDLIAVQKLCSRSLLLASGGLAFDDNTINTITQYLKGDIENNNFSLQGDLKNRRGFGKIKLQQLSIESRSYNIGDDIKINFSVNSAEEVDDCLIYIAIKNIQGIEVFYATNRYANKFSNLEIGNTDGLIIISPNYLMPGIYSIRFTINQGGTISDWIEDVIKFEIDPTCEKFELIPDYKVGFFHHPIKWEFA